MFELFPNEETVTAWFEKTRWEGTPTCPRCNSSEITLRENRIPQPYWCRPCRKYFSIRTGTQLEHSKVPPGTWAIALYLFLSYPKGISSIQLGKNLNIRQATSWRMLKRIREMAVSELQSFSGIVEVDETYIGGKRKNMSNKKWAEPRPTAGRGVAGKAPVLGIKCRDTEKIKAKVIDRTDSTTIHQYIHQHTTDDAIVYSDEHRAYNNLDRAQGSVSHSSHEYVDGIIHINGIESFWAIIKRAYRGTYHWMSRKHLQLYVNEFVWRYNTRDLPILDRIGLLIRNSQTGHI